LARKAYELTEKSFQSSLAQDRIYFWLVSNIYKLDVANGKPQGERDEYYQLYPKERLSEHLEKFCSDLLKTTDLTKERNCYPIRYEKLRTLEATTTRDLEEDEDEMDDPIRKEAKKATKLII